MSHPTPKPPWLAWQNSRLLKYLLWFALGWCLVQVIAYFSVVITLVVVAAILAFLLSYPVAWLERFLPRFGAVITVFLVSFIVLGGVGITLGLAVITQAQQLLAQIPQDADWFSYLDNFLTRFNVALDLRQLENQLQQQILTALSFSVNTVQGILGNALNFILILVIAFFMLLDGARPWQFLLSFLPEPLQTSLPQALRRNFIGFFWGQFILSLIFGLAVFIVFLLFQIPFALVLAAIVAVFDLVPGIGATLGVLSIALIVLPQGVWLSLQVVVICIILQQIQDNFLMPRIMKGSVNLNPVVLFIALLIGATLAGLLGVFLAIPVTGTIVSLWEIEAFQG